MHSIYLNATILVYSILVLHWHHSFPSVFFCRSFSKQKRSKYSAQTYLAAHSVRSHSNCLVTILWRPTMLWWYSRAVVLLRAKQLLHARTTILLYTRAERKMRVENKRRGVAHRRWYYNIICIHRFDMWLSDFHQHALSGYIGDTHKFCGRQ